MIQQGQTTSFKLELYEGVHNFTADTFNIALYDGNANLTQATTEYLTDNEIIGTGYNAGGETLTNVTVNALENTAYISFNNALWPNATFSTRCALIYNVSKDNKSVAVLDFGALKTVSDQTFTITFPPNTADSAIIRSS